MWRSLLNFIAAALTLARDLDERRKESKEIREELHRLSLAIVKLQDQLIGLADREQAEREKLALRLQLEAKLPAPKRPAKKKSSRKSK
jgi:hypothetical protein